MLTTGVAGSDTNSLKLSWLSNGVVCSRPELAPPVAAPGKLVSSRCRRPLIRVAPLVASHYEVTHRLFVVHAVVYALQVVIHPAQNDLVVVDRRGRAELTLSGSRFCGVVHAMNPRPKQKVSARRPCRPAGPSADLHSS